jgi:hypothetical protein
MYKGNLKYNFYLVVFLIICILNLNYVGGKSIIIPNSEDEISTDSTTPPPPPPPSQPQPQPLVLGPIDQDAPSENEASQNSNNKITQNDNTINVENSQSNNLRGSSGETVAIASPMDINRAPNPPKIGKKSKG